MIVDPCQPFSGDIATPVATTTVTPTPIEWKLKWDNLYPNSYEICSRRYTRFIYDQTHLWPSTRDAVFVLIDRYDTVTEGYISFVVRAPAHYLEHISELNYSLRAARAGWLRALLSHDGEPSWMPIIHGYGVWLRYLDRVQGLIFDEIQTVLGDIFSRPLLLRDEYDTKHFRLPTLEEFTVKTRLQLHAIPPANFTKEQLQQFGGDSIPQPWLAGWSEPVPIPNCAHWVTAMFTKAVPEIAPLDILDLKHAGLGGSQWKREPNEPISYPPIHSGEFYTQDWEEFRWRDPFLVGMESYINWPK